MDETTIVNENEKPYELRALTSKDIFPVFTIMGKIGFKEFKSCFESDEVKKAVKKVIDSGDDKDIKESVGITVFIDIAGIVISNISSCEKDIYKLLSSLSGMTVQEIEELPLGTFTEMIVDVVKADGFRDFIKVVSKLFK